MDKGLFKSQLKKQFRLYYFLRYVFRRRSKIICIGLGKTGTTSFASAMKILGYRHKSQGHGYAFENQYYFMMLPTLYRFDSFDDFPWPFVYKFIHKKFPSSKFILTTRVTPEAWLASLQKHYCKHGPSINNKIFYGYFSPFENRDHFLNLYDHHNEKIRRYFGGNPNFLEVCWERGAGWSELCGFLGHSVPNVPFPHMNAATREFDYNHARLQADEQLEKMRKSR